MTISASADPTHYTGTGADTALTTVWPFFTATDVVVTQRITATGAVAVLVADTHYTVAGGSSTGLVGTVTPLAGATDFTTAMTWTLERNIPLTQALDYAASGIFPAESHEVGLDKLTMLHQDRDATVDRALTFPVTDALALTNILPSSIDRASKVLTFDSNGNARASTLTTVGYGRVLLDEHARTAPAISKLTVNATNWPLLYDMVELEVISVRPVSGGTFEIRPIDDGSQITANLESLLSEHTAAPAQAHTVRTDWELATSTGASSDDNLMGVMRFFFGGSGANKFLYGFGSFVHRTGTDIAKSDLTVMYTAVPTSLDGFDVLFNTQNLTGTIRLWGIPKA